MRISQSLSRSGFTGGAFIRSGPTSIIISTICVSRARMSSGSAAISARTMSFRTSTRHAVIRRRYRNYTIISSVVDRAPIGPISYSKVAVAQAPKRAQTAQMSQSEVQDAASQPLSPSSVYADETSATPDKPTAFVQQTVYPVIFAIAFCHMLNDMMQSLLPAIYPNLKKAFDLDFAHIGLVTFTFQVTSSLLQPLVGMATDKRAVPFALPTAMVATFLGLLLLAFANSYALLLVAAATVGIGSSVFHPESSRVAHMAAGPRRGIAQAMFQVGGNTGSALGALGAASIVAMEGQRSVAWFCVMAAIAIGVLTWVGQWYKTHGLARAKKAHA